MGGRGNADSDQAAATLQFPLFYCLVFVDCCNWKGPACRCILDPFGGCNSGTPSENACAVWAGCESGTGCCWRGGGARLTVAWQQAHLGLAMWVALVCCTWLAWNALCVSPPPPPRFLTDVVGRAVGTMSVAGYGLLSLLRRLEVAQEFCILVTSICSCSSSHTTPDRRAQSRMLCCMPVVCVCGGGGRRGARSKDSGHADGTVAVHISGAAVVDAAAGGHIRCSWRAHRHVHSGPLQLLQLTTL